MKASILIADDHELMRDGIRARIDAHPGWSVCAVASTGRQAVELARQFRPDVVVLDIAMGELNGLAAAQQIRRESPGTEVLILTMHESETVARKALEAGARGFLVKTDAARLLVGAIEALLRHEPFFTSAVTDLMLAEFLDPDRLAAGGGAASHRVLTARETEVVQLLAEGRTSKEAASTLGVSVSTVEAHRANVMRKLDLHTIADLVRYAVREGIIQP